MVIPPTYRKSPSYNVTYTFQDFLTNTSYLTLYATHLTDSGANAVTTLSSQRIDSDPVKTSNTSYTTGGVDTKFIDYDYDLLLDNPLEIKGKAKINITFRINVVGGTISAWVIAKLRKWDGSSETEIASGTSTTISATGIKRASIEIDISSKIHLKKGDTLRLTIEGWVNSTNAANDIFFYHDSGNNKAYAYETDSLTYGFRDVDTILNLPIVSIV